MAPPLVLFALLCTVWFGGHDRLALAASRMLPGGGEHIDARFARCKGRPAGNCVVDGDTIRMGERRIRLIGFDAPETNARCQSEALAAERATDGLETWLNRAPFVLGSEFGTPDTDRYGRNLRNAFRPLAHGEIDLLSRYMVDRGLARSYGGGTRASWC